MATIRVGGQAVEHRIDTLQYMSGTGVAVLVQNVAVQLLTTLMTRRRANQPRPPSMPSSAGSNRSPMSAMPTETRSPQKTH